MTLFGRLAPAGAARVEPAGVDVRDAVGPGGYGRAVDRRKPVLNLTEAAVDRMLAEYAEENGYRIGLKMRLRDVIEVDDLPLTPRERNFTFTAHLDFVALDAETHLPVLAVEYDGAQHLVDD